MIAAARRGSSGHRHGGGLAPLDCLVGLIVQGAPEKQREMSNGAERWRGPIGNASTA